MIYYFYDASAFIAQSRIDDEHHQQALKIADKLDKENAVGYTTDFVLAEVLTFLRYKAGHQASLSLL